MSQLYTVTKKHKTGYKTDMNGSRVEEKVYSENVDGPGQGSVRDQPWQQTGMHDVVFKLNYCSGKFFRRTPRPWIWGFSILALSHLIPLIPLLKDHTSTKKRWQNVYKELDKHHLHHHGCLCEQYSNSTPWYNLRSLPHPGMCVQPLPDHRHATCTTAFILLSLITLNSTNTALFLSLPWHTLKSRECVWNVIFLQK